MPDDDNDQADKILVPNDRIFSRSQGCWSCKHMARAGEWWKEKRQDQLNIALGIANDSPMKEDDPKVFNIRRMVDTTDHAVAAGALVRCTGKGETARGESVGDLVAHSYLCHKWSGAQGASMARGGGKPDELPEELIEKLDGPQPKCNPLLSTRSINDNEDN